MHLKSLAHCGLGLACVLALAGCDGGRVKLGGDPQLHVVPSADFPAPEPADLTHQGRPYLIGPSDKINIDVFGVPELANRDVQVDAAGRISLPLIGVMDVTGRSPAEIEEMVDARLRGNFVRNPETIVNLKETVNQVVTIEGQVARPGLYPVVGRMTLMRAMATAGGTAEFSKNRAIVVFRTVKGQHLAALYDLQAIRRGAYPDPDIFANDVISVNENINRRRFRDYLALLPAISTPIFLIVDRLTR